MPDKAQKIERLRVIERLIDEALTIADAEDEHLLGAKLVDCMTCTVERMEALNA